MVWSFCIDLETKLLGMYKGKGVNAACKALQNPQGGSGS